jgi:hypothetical protein
MSKVMSFGEIREALMHFYKTTITRRKNKLYEYKGPDLTSNSILVTSFPIKEQLSKRQFEYRIEHKGDHPMELLLTAAIQLGIQQGIYLCAEDPYTHIDKKKLEELRVLLNTIKELKDNNG